MTTTNFTGFWLVTSYDTPIIKKVVGQYVRDGDLYLVVQDPETRGCEVTELDSYHDDDLFAPEDHAFAVVHSERKAAENAETEEAA